MIRWWVNRINEKTQGRLAPKVPSIDHLLDEVLGIGKYVWPVIRQDLKAISGEKINEVNKLDGVGAGKSKLAVMLAIDTLYVLGHLKDPAAIFGQMPGSKLALVIMSLREKQAKSIIYGDIRDYVNECAWFRKHYKPIEQGGMLMFPNKVFVMSGSSSESVPIGFNVIMGVLDEGDWFIAQSHKGDSLDQAENVYGPMKDRIETRFGKKGLLVLVTSARQSDGFMVKRYEETEGTPHVYRTRRPMWESKPGKLNDGGSWAPYFMVDLEKLEIVREGMAEAYYEEGKYVSVPEAQREAYNRNPRKFLRDRASIILIHEQSYVLRPDLIRVNKMRENPVGLDGKLAGNLRPKSNTIYYGHGDLGGTRDKCVFSIGHKDGDDIVIDMIYIIIPKEVGKVDFSRVRTIIRELMHRGFMFGKITFDSWQSFETIRKLETWGLRAELFSVDRDMRAYDLWLEAHLGERIDVPYVEGYERCVRSLIVKGNKVDHKSQGEKDITDSVAGVVYHCEMESGGDAVQVRTTKHTGARNKARAFTTLR